MNKVILATAALLVAGHLSAAEKGLAFGLKLRAQGGLETVDGMRNGFGFGVYSALPLGPGNFGVELGYQTYSGKHWMEPVPANVFPAVTNANSVDSRKNSADGLSLRLNYGMKFSEAWGWHAGLAVSKLKGRHESITNFGATSAYGGWAMVVEKSSVTTAPFAGLTYDFGEKGFFEFNVMLASYKMGTVDASYDAAATGFNRVTPVIGEKSINKPKIEIGYAFKF